MRGRTGLHGDVRAELHGGRRCSGVRESCSSNYAAGLLRKALNQQWEEMSRQTQTTAASEV